MHFLSLEKKLRTLYDVVNQARVSYGTKGFCTGTFLWTLGILLTTPLIFPLFFKTDTLSIFYSDEDKDGATLQTTVRISKSFMKNSTFHSMKQYFTFASKS